MTAFQPGFMDDPRPPEPPPVTAATLERPLDPGFIDTISAPPEALPMRVPLPLPSPGLGAIGWIAAGLGILVAGGSLLSLIGFVIDQMARSPVLGWISLATVSAGVLEITPRVALPATVMAPEPAPFVISSTPALTVVGPL